MAKVLVIATSHKTHGGITSVVQAHRHGGQWEKYNCLWIETHRDKGIILKFLYLIKGLVEFIVLLPWSSIVHIHVGAPPSAVRKLIFLTLAKLANKRIIVHLHAFSPESSIRSNKKNIYKYLFDSADIVIVLSKYWEREVKLTFPELNDRTDKVRVLPNPCVTEIKSNIYEVKKQILYAAVLNERKGYADLIRAFSKIAGLYADWKVTFAGSGEVSTAESLAKELGISKQVEFIGWVSGETKDKVFKESAIICLPSYAEGFPMTVLDAWAYGKPVIATHVGGLQDIAKDGENVLLFTPGDINALSKKLELLINNADLRYKLSQESLKLAATTFNPTTINRQLDNIYAELLKKKTYE